MSRVMTPGRRQGDEWLDTLMKGVAVARDIYGIKTASDEADRKEQADEAGKAERKRFAEGKLNKGEQIELGTKGMSPAKEGDPGAIPFTDADTGAVSWVAKQSKPTITPPKVVGNSLVAQDPKTGEYRPVYSAPSTGGGAGKPHTYVDDEGNERVGTTVGGVPTKSGNDFIKTPAAFTPAGGRKATKDAAMKIEGLEVLPGHQPSVKDAEDVKKGSEVYNNIVGQLDRLDAIYKESGTNVFGEAATEQEQLVTGIQMDLKELQNLGVINGPDLQLLRTQVPDPTSGVENVKGAFGQDRVGTKSAGFRTTLDARFDNKLKARGFTRQGAQEQTGDADAPPASPAAPPAARSAFTRGGAAPGSRTKPQPSAEDTAALEWLEANPKDPAAPGVRAGLKARGF